MKRLLTLFTLLLTLTLPPVCAQVLSLDSCRALSLRNNKAIGMAREQMEKAYYDRKAARTNYLPKVALAAGYVRTGDEISQIGRAHV